MTISLEKQNEILRLRASGHGYKTISKQTGIPRTTVKRIINHPVPHSQTNNGLTKTAPPGPQDFNWVNKLDKAGQGLFGLYEKALEKGDERGARAWMESFLRAAQVKAGTNVRFTQVNITPTGGQLSRVQLLEALQREDNGPTCLLCGHERKPSGGRS